MPKNAKRKLLQNGKGMDRRRNFSFWDPYVKGSQRQFFNHFWLNFCRQGGRTSGKLDPVLEKPPGRLLAKPPWMDLAAMIKLTASAAPPPATKLWKIRQELRFGTFYIGISTRLKSWARWADQVRAVTAAMSATCLKTPVLLQYSYNDNIYFFEMNDFLCTWLPFACRLSAENPRQPVPV